MCWYVYTYLWLEEEAQGFRTTQFLMRYMSVCAPTLTLRITHVFGTSDTAPSKDVSCSDAPSTRSGPKRFPWPRRLRLPRNFDAFLLSIATCPWLPILTKLCVEIGMMLYDLGQWLCSACVLSRSPELYVRGTLVSGSSHKMS